MDCPFCAEPIKNEANVCKHCGRDLIAIRPLLDANQTLTKRIDALEHDLAAFEEAQRRLHRRVGLAGSSVPSINRGSAVAFAVLWIFVIGLFISDVIAKHKSGMPILYATTGLMVLPLIFGFLCENLKIRPSFSDFLVAVLVTAVAIVEVQIIRWELLDGALIPRGWNLDHSSGGLPSDSWSFLLLNSVTIFLSFSAGIFFRYQMQSRHQAHDAPVTFARPLSQHLVYRWGGSLSGPEFEAQVKRLDTIIHALTGVGAAGGAVVAYVVSHLS